MPTPEEDKAKKDAEMEETKKKADAEKEETEKKADAEAGEKLDKVLSCLDSWGKRMDAIEADIKKADAEKEKEKPEFLKKEDADKEEDEKKKADAEEKEKADKAKKDAEEKEEDKKKADAKADSDSDIRKRIADVEAKLPKAMADADYHAMTDVQAMADSHFQAHGLHAPRFMTGEDALAYRKRLAGSLKKHSAVWKDIELAPFADNSFAIAEQQIYAASDSAAQNPTDLPDFALRQVTRTDPTTGQRMTMFYGKNTFISQLKRPSRRVAHIGVRKDN